MKWPGKLYRLANILSIDVAAGAAIGSLFFADFFGIPVGLNAISCLIISVWLIYTCDHLLDAYWLQSDAVTERHAFHRRNFSILVTVVLVAAVIDVLLVISLPHLIIRKGLWLSVPVILYLMFINRIAILKEPVAAAMYCAGVLVPVEIGYPVNLAGELLIAQFYLVVLMNLLLFSWFDVSKDRAQGTHSGVLVIGKRWTGAIIWLLFLLNSAIMITSGAGLHAVLLWSIASGNIVLYVFHRTFSAADKFRVIGDALFLLPVLSIFIS